MFLYIGIVAVTVLAAAGVKETAGWPRGTRGRALHVSCLFLIFLVLAIPAVLRQETGNDYLRYVEFFHLASINAYVPTEEGFNLIVRLIYSLCGYENYILVFAVFAVLTITLMLTAIRQQAENFLFSFFLFMAFAYYFHSYNTMRYYCALAIVMVSVTYFIRKRYICWILLVLAAALLHKSALIVLVLYPLAAHLWRVWQIAALTLAGAAVLVFHDEVIGLLLALYPSWEDTVDLAAGTSISWVNIARCAGTLLVTAVMLWLQGDGDRSEAEDRLAFEAEGALSVKGTAGPDSSEAAPAQSFAQKAAGVRLKFCEDRQLRIYVNASMLGMLIHIFGWFIPEISRICYYLTFTQIFLIPMAIARIPREHGRLRRLLLGVVIAAALVYFAMFLREAYGDTTKILPYKSFLFHDLNQTPSGSIE